MAIWFSRPYRPPILVVAPEGLRAYIDAQWSELLFAQKQQERIELLSAAQINTITDYYRMLQWCIQMTLSKLQNCVTDRRGPYKWKPNKLFDDDSMRLLITEAVQLLNEATPTGRQQMAKKGS